MEEAAEVEEEEEEGSKHNEDDDGRGVNGAAAEAWKWPLSAQEYDRYGRQLVLPNVGIQGAFCRWVWYCLPLYRTIYKLY